MFSAGIYDYGIELSVENGSWLEHEKKGYLWNFMQTYQTAKRNCTKMNEHLKMLFEKIKPSEQKEAYGDDEIYYDTGTSATYETNLVTKYGFNLNALDKLVEKGVIIDDRDKKYD